MSALSTVESERGPVSRAPRPEMSRRQGDEGFGLYIHWPFCPSKCPYCDFNSHAASVIDQPLWRRALLRELATAAAEAAGDERVLTSIFFGGGTPSLMEPATTAALIERAGELFVCADDLEITLEANPGTVDRGRFAAFRQAGVNRISLGVQSLRADSLRFLERRHGRDEAIAAITAAGELFPRYSFDLIYARPGQTVEDWHQELSEAVSLAGDHLSLYQLTIEQGTRFFADHARGAFVIPEDDLAIALYEVTQEVMEAVGRPAYEVSNHARPGAECRHNLTYWRGGDYMAVGPGAHGRLRRGGVTYAMRRHRAPDRWLALLEADGHATKGHTTKEYLALTPKERCEELILLGLRLSEGLDPDRFARLTGRPLAEVLDLSAVACLREDGLIAPGWPLRATRRGVLCLNALIAQVMI